MIIRREGDLFDYEHQAYAHGLRTDGSVVHGAATQFARLYPSLAGECTKRCSAGVLGGGDVFFYEAVGVPAVFNLVIYDLDNVLRQNYVQRSFENMYVQARRRKITDIAMATVGFLDEMSEEEVMRVLDPFFNDSSHHVTIYELNPKWLDGPRLQRCE